MLVISTTPKLYSANTSINCVIIGISIIIKMSRIITIIITVDIILTWSSQIAYTRIGVVISITFSYKTSSNRTNNNEQYYHPNHNGYNIED